jgi:adenosylcobinamide kinase/adenosylcobinamide-phosphate guanylyltransferase
MKKALFIGGIKSGKSFNAELYAIKNSTTKPIYLATTEFIDDEMKKRIDEHKKSRNDTFKTIEEPLKLYNTISKCSDSVLVECVSMWINNMLYHGFKYDDMSYELEKILALDKTIVFVLNDVGTGVVSENKLVREFVDISGKLSQQIAAKCDEVFHTIAGISTKIK